MATGMKPSMYDVSQAGHCANCKPAVGMLLLKISPKILTVCDLQKNGTLGNMISCVFMGLRVRIKAHTKVFHVH